ncbi:glycosyltransferase family 4 protein [Desulfoplanes formicivorans]|nr:glycosyltransferase [Desulfoplanes formicivorans]
MSTSTSNLQPWLTIYNVAQYLSNNGFDIHIITDVKNPENIKNINIHIVKSLLSNNSKEIINIVDSIDPEYIVVSVTPFSLLFNTWYDKLNGIKKIAFFSYSLYTKKEILKSLKFINLKNRFEFGRELIIPTHFSLSILSKKFDFAVCQSNRTYNRVKRHLKDFIIYKIDPGIVLEDWEYENKTFSDQTLFLYTGSPKKIRGFYTLLKAFSLISQENVRLKILARGTEPEALHCIEKYIRQKKLGHKVSLVGGWIDRATLNKELLHADLLTLPFVLVPAELPVTLMESIASGTPVLVTDIDGLPDAVGRAGLVAPHADIAGLSKVMLHFHQNVAEKKRLHDACHHQRSNMKSWNDIGKLWEQALKRHV